MRIPRTVTSAISAGTAVALLAACSSGGQLAPRAPVTGDSAQSRIGAVADGANGVLGIPSLRMSTNRPGAGWLSPEAKAAKQLFFVSDQANQRIAIFSQRGQNPAPVGQITDGISGPDGLFLDPKGTLYVCNFGAGTITEYKKGRTKNSKTLTGAGSPKYVVTGTDGTVYVSNFNGSFNGQVLEYAGGSTTPTTTIQVEKFPTGLALDKNNNLYVSYNDSNHNDLEVLEFAPGSTQGTNLGIHVTGGYGGGATMDRQGNLILVNQASAQVLVFPPGATSPSQTYTGFSLAYAVAPNHRNNHLYVSDPFAPSVTEITYPAGKVINTINNSLGTAFGVATSPDGSY